MKNAFELLRNVNTRSAYIPGSNAAKLLVCNCICSYFGIFGMPLIYLALNPCAAHIFQVFYGGTTIDLTISHPFLISSTEHSICLSHDPVAASDFFDFCIRMIFTHLFEWSYKKHDSTIEGGILGHLQA